MATSQLREEECLVMPLSLVERALAKPLPIGPIGLHVWVDDWERTPLTTDSKGPHPENSLDHRALGNLTCERAHCCTWCESMSSLLRWDAFPGKFAAYLFTGEAGLFLSSGPQFSVGDCWCAIHPSLSPHVSLCTQGLSNPFPTIAHVVIPHLLYHVE